MPERIASFAELRRAARRRGAAVAVVVWRGGGGVVGGLVGRARCWCASVVAPSSQVGLADGGVVAEVIGVAGQDGFAGFEDVGAVGEVQRDVGVLLDDEHGHVFGGVELAEDPEDVLHDERGEPQRRFVQQQQLGRDMRARATASICCSPPERLPACCVRRSRGGGTCRTSGRCRRRPGRDARRRRPQVVLDRQVIERAAALGDVGDAAPHDVAGVPPANSSPSKRIEPPVVTIWQIAGRVVVLPAPLAPNRPPPRRARP